MRYLIFFVLGLAVLVSSACRGSDSKKAVEQAIQKHLDQQPGLMMANMKMELQDVKFNGASAVADVRYVSKQAPGASVIVRYQLRRAGGAEGEWIVQSSAALSMSGIDGSSPHGGAGGAPPEDSGPKDQPAIPAPEASH